MLESNTTLKNYIMSSVGIFNRVDIFFSLLFNNYCADFTRDKMSVDEIFDFIEKCVEVFKTSLYK